MKTNTPVAPNNEPVINSPSSRPLSGFAKLALILSSAGIIVAFYLFCLGTIAMVSVLLAVEAIIAIAAARFGGLSWMLPYLEAHARLIALLARSLWLTSGENFRLRLEHSDAPALFGLVEKLSTDLRTPPPQTIFLEMNSGAWVQLRGFSRTRGLGTARLGIGYDLLACLTVQETEAVLAHEMAHAKLVSRVFTNWQRKGVARSVRFSQQLSALVDAHRRVNRPAAGAQGILNGADRLTRLCVRLAAAYSRQDEFEADRGAATLRGSAPLRSSLVKLEKVQSKLARLPWNERISQLRSAPSFSTWLVQELSVPPVSISTEPEIFDPYSTHPSLPDRLAALPHDDSELIPDDAPGLSLIANPDEAASRLQVDIERVLLKQEQKDDRELRSWLRKARSHSGNAKSRRAALFFAVPALIVLAVALLTSSTEVILIAGAVATIAIVVFLSHRPKERITLPLPTFNQLEKDPVFPSSDDDFAAFAKKTRVELGAQTDTVFGDEKKAHAIARAAFTALANIDYPRALVAARSCLSYHRDNVEGHIALAIAAGAAPDQQHECKRAINFLVEKTALATVSVKHGAAWAFFKLGAWDACEAILLSLLKSSPQDPTLLALRGKCQMRRGKLRSALAILRPLAGLGATYRQVLIEALLDAGETAEAQTHLDALPVNSSSDHPVIVLQIRSSLLRRDIATAEHWAHQLKEQNSSADTLLSLGLLFDNARVDARAEEYYRHTLTVGHAPSAWLGLARVSMNASDKNAARAALLRALDTTPKPASRVPSVLQLLPTTLAMLTSLEEKMPKCPAWFATFLDGGKAGHFAQCTLVIYAIDPASAEEYLRTILSALTPDKPAPTRAFYTIKPAPADLQPARPVTPGVQYVYS